MSAPKIGPQPLPKATFEEKLKEFDSIPLFMKSLPEEETDDPTIAALQALAHEGTPDGRFGLHSAAAMVSDRP
jgi:small subunit ribosomal protein S7e